MPATNLSQIAIPYPANSQAYAQIFAHWDGFIWLDSGTRREYCSGYDLITARPSQTLCAHSYEDIRLSQEGTTQRLSLEEAQRWCEAQTHLRQISATQEFNTEIPFSGGLIGYIGYEWMHGTFKLPLLNRYATPLVYLGVYEWALVINHELKDAFFVFTDEASEHLREEVLQLFHSPATTPTGANESNFICSSFVPQTPKSQYLADVNTVLDFINAGDCYQVNYSQAFTATFSGDSFSAYCQLRQGCPGPFSAYISTQQGAILSLSPEQFIHIAPNHKATSRPIKGTAARSAQPEQDHEQAQALHQSIKNRAENLMIVDLLRNDFSKHCMPGSVKVPELFTLYSFANVHHLISTIEGQLKPATNRWRFIMDAFPGGSITGAPKKRAMEIIHQLEPHQRHIYCGCIGFWSRNGHTHSNIAIRTLLIEGEQITLWGGGGVVADSNAEDEYQESLDKIAVFKSILMQAAK